MGKINILDCTLREAPIKDLIIGKEYIQKFINALENSNIDIIECGFLKDMGHREDNTIFQKVEEIEPYLSSKKQTALYVALVDYGRYNLKYLKAYDGKSIDGIRICFKKHEQDVVFEYAKEIKNKGYKVFLQHVDTLSYSDIELLNFIEKVNELNPYAYSIVDTFGSMYAEDLRHIYELVDKNLKNEIRLGFHAHNNLMLAVANSQFFISLANVKREITVDASVLGCGRGAGNANTELIAEFLNYKYGAKYNLDELLDIIDILMPKFKKECKWGYSIPYFLSGIHNAHVFNVNHLLKRHNIKSKDLRAIIEKLDDIQKKKYDDTVLERLYVEHFNNHIDDSKNINELKNIIKNKKVLLLAPGVTIKENKNKILYFINKEHPFVIAINNYMPEFPLDAVFFTNQLRYFENIDKIKNVKIMTTSNLKTNEDVMQFDYMSLVKFGWINLDNSSVLTLRLFINLGIKEFYFAGLDGYTIQNREYYYNENLTNPADEEIFELLVKETREMFQDIQKTTTINVHFITPSIYEDIFQKESINV